MKPVILDVIPSPYVTSWWVIDVLWILAGQPLLERFTVPHVLHLADWQMPVTLECGMCCFLRSFSLLHFVRQSITLDQDVTPGYAFFPHILHQQLIKDFARWLVGLTCEQVELLVELKQLEGAPRSPALLFGEAVINVPLVFGGPTHPQAWQEPLISLII